MIELLGLIHLSGIYPLWRGWRANRATTLFQAIHWAGVAWLAWGMVVWGERSLSTEGLQIARYLALSLTGCAGVAVLGARRPGVGPWNFVLLGLLAVILLPLGESLLSRGHLHLDWPRMLFLSATLAVTVLNYLPTRLGLAGALLGCGGLLELLRLTDSDTLSKYTLLGPALAAFVPWSALERLGSRPTPESAFDQAWLDFRDRFGFIWSQRLRDQFNSSAGHAGWPVVLRWQGLRLFPGADRPAPAEQEAMLSVLNALLMRFRARDEMDRA